MEASGVWKNLLSGKQGVPTVACPSCGAQVPEFRIHSHLDTCLAVVLQPEEPGAELVEHELSDHSGEQSRRGARTRGRGRAGRKRREARETAGRNKRSKHIHVEGDEKELVDAAAAAVEEDDEYASFYQRWEYSVAGLDSARNPLSVTQKRELLLSSGMLAIERTSEVAAMVSQLDRLLGESCQTTPEGGNRSDHGEEAREAWWEQWVIEEWPQGPLPSGFDAGLPPLRLQQSELREVGRERAAETAAAIGGLYTSAICSILNLSESGGIIGGRSARVLSHSSESSRREVIEIGIESPQEKQSLPSGGMVHSSPLNPNVERSTDAAESSRRPGPSSTAAAKNPAQTNGASPGLQACPICNCPFAQGASNREINDHIDQCLTEVACQFD